MLVEESRHKVWHIHLACIPRVEPRGRSRNATGLCPCYLVGIAIEPHLHVAGHLIVVGGALRAISQDGLGRIIASNHHEPVGAAHAEDIDHGRRRPCFARVAVERESEVQLLVAF